MGNKSVGAETPVVILPSVTVSVLDFWQLLVRLINRSLFSVSKSLNYFYLVRNSLEGALKLKAGRKDVVSRCLLSDPTNGI